jgi:DNA-binding NtrC family response regulator
MEKLSRTIKVIIIDDEKMVRLNLLDYLEDEGFLVTALPSGEKALALLRTQAYDVAIVDMRLSGMDGNLFILEAHRLQPELRYLIHTGSATYSLPPELKELGIASNHIFLKPLQDMGKIVRGIHLLVNER